MSSKRSLFRAIAFSLGALWAAGGWASLADAQSRFSEDEYDDVHYDSRLFGRTPLLAVVALKQQRVTIYDAKGKIMDSPVSSGQNGLETPAGIFSIVQKEEDHRSNIYDDAEMPFMERITWTGISLHAGVLPGYPASHGCVRMPYRFAEDLYQVTKLGMRVVIVREDIAPADIAQPAMFASTTARPGDPLARLRTEARDKFMEAEAAVKRFRDAKTAASKAATDAAVAQKALKAAETSLASAETELKAASQAIGTATMPERIVQAQTLKEQALGKAEALRSKLEAAKADAQAKAEAADKAEQEVNAATTATAIAHDASAEAQLNLQPVSVFISRKTQRLYIRKNNQPVFEAPVKIRDADKPIGSFVFTALEYSGGVMRWNVVSLYRSSLPEAAEPAPKGVSKVSHAEAAPADANSAQAALARITVTPESQERISAAVLPGSSLIVSDEGPSVETGKDTDFVVVMSSDPQGGLTMRHHQTASRRDDDWGDGFFGAFARRRPSYGGGWGGGGGGGGGWGFFSQ
jgi:hypothetical protein